MFDIQVVCHSFLHDEDTLSVHSVKTFAVRELI